MLQLSTDLFTELSQFHIFFWPQIVPDGTVIHAHLVAPENT
jgi:hypothetical protein